MHDEHCGPNLQSTSHSAELQAGKTPVQCLLDLELSVGGESRYYGTGQPVFDDDRGSAGCMAKVRGRPVCRGDVPAEHRWNTGTLSPLFGELSECSRGRDR